MTTKQLEQETGCKIMVRGKGSMRDKKKVSIDFTWIKESFISEDCWKIFETLLSIYLFLLNSNNRDLIL